MYFQRAMTNIQYAIDELTTDNVTLADGHIENMIADLKSLLSKLENHSDFYEDENTSFE